MKIRPVRHNNRKKKASPTPPTEDPVTELSVDAEAGREAFTYVLHSGRTGPVHVEQVLEYNQDPDLPPRSPVVPIGARSAEASCGEPALKAGSCAGLGTSAAQLYRLLDQTNYRKSVDQLLALLQVLSDVDLVVGRTLREATRLNRSNCDVTVT